MTTTVLAKRSVGTNVTNLDAIIIGAGFGGIYMLKKGVGGATEQKVHLSSVAAPQTLATSG
ncbi:hypothetical protein [Stutzerimonas kunmingensis]|uniref:hypothetical protein n=1 Tax=Stutzerimonas kunmingensis TaxID=1211807 RepID=UPI0035B3AC1B